MHLLDSLCNIFHLVFALDGVPKMNQLLSLELRNGDELKIIETIGIHYREFGNHFLGNHHKVNNIVENDVLHIVETICEYWLDGKGVFPITWSTFVGVLEKSNLNTLADDIRNEYSTVRDEL